MLTQLEYAAIYFAVFVALILGLWLISQWLISKVGEPDEEAQKE
mgnify:CR=1 FL=1